MTTYMWWLEWLIWTSDRSPPPPPVLVLVLHFLEPSALFLRSHFLSPVQDLSIADRHLLVVSECLGLLPLEDFVLDQVLMS